MMAKPERLLVSVIHWEKQMNRSIYTFQVQDKLSTHVDYQKKKKKRTSQNGLKVAIKTKSIF